MTAPTLVEPDRVEVKIPFARSSTGTVVSVDAVDRGLACGCVCLSCGSPLVARHGEQLQHHFAHYSEPENCEGARETAIHKFAKQLICDTRELRLPDDLDLGAIQNAQQEIWLDGIRPDVLVQFDDPFDHDDAQVAIEIFVAHRVPSEKIKELVKRGLAALEIDLSRYRNLDKSEQEWTTIVQKIAPRFWLHPPAVVRERIEREAREAAERAREAAESEQRAARELREKEERAACEAWERQELQRSREIELGQLRQYRERQDREHRDRIDAEQKRREQAKLQATLQRMHPFPLVHDDDDDDDEIEREIERRSSRGIVEISGVDEFSKRCSTCGIGSNAGWARGLRKDWQSGEWFCLDHRPWAARSNEVAP